MYMLDLAKRFITVCDLKINIINIPEIIEFMIDRIRDNKPTAYIVTTNANTIVLSKNNVKIKEAVNNGDLSIADGYSLVLASRFYGKPLKRRTYGPDLMLEFLRISQQRGYSNFFYGSTKQTLNMLAQGLKNRYPRLNIVGYYSPAFDVSIKSDKEEIEIINKAHPDVVWVGLGGIKQERWMYEHKDKINAPVLVGVGAAFDFLAGTKLQAPKWMREMGLEWFFRLITEPKRLWRRYLINNLFFIWYVSADILKKRFKVRHNKGHV